MSEFRLPDFIIAGAPRSGTTWLYHLLDRQPSVFMAKPVAPEPKFFLIDQLYEQGLQTYSEKWFGAAPQGSLLGEKSTNYLERPNAATRIHSCLKDVRIIFMLRDPILRAYSNFLWSRKNGIETETNFLNALKFEKSRTDSLLPKYQYSRPFSYFERGLYADLLAPYLKLFGRERILVLKYEDIPENPEKIGEQLTRFLRFTSPIQTEEIGVINASIRDESIPSDAANFLREKYDEPNRRLERLLGTDFQIWS